MARILCSLCALGLLGLASACPPPAGEDAATPHADASGADRGSLDRAVAPDQAVAVDSTAPDRVGPDTTGPGDAAAVDTPGPDSALPADAGSASDRAPDDTGSADRAPHPDASVVDASGPDRFDAGPECSDEDGGPGCPPEQTCCGGRCVDLAADPAHCGACDRRCDPIAYCADTPACTALDFSTLCENDLRYDLRTAASDDNVVLTATADAIAARCSGTVTHTTLSNAALVDQATYAPLVGIGHLLILHGGPFYQRMTRHFEETGVAPLRYDYDAAGDRDRFIKTVGGEVVLDSDALYNDADHDYFIVELFADPARGALILASYGFDLPGSTAAGWYIVHHLLAAPAPLASWYVVEWTDLDANLAPSSLDEFVLVRSAAD